MKQQPSALLIVMLALIISGSILWYINAKYKHEQQMRIFELQSIQLQKAGVLG